MRWQRVIKFATFLLLVIGVSSAEIAPAYTEVGKSLFPDTTSRKSISGTTR